MSRDRSHWHRRILDIETFIDKVQTMLEGKTKDDFDDDETLYFATERLIQNIGEATIHLPEDIKNKYSDIPWKDIAGMRHILVHGYDIADSFITWKTATEDIQILKEFCDDVREKENI